MKELCFEGIHMHAGMLNAWQAYIHVLLGFKNCMLPEMTLTARIGTQAVAKQSNFQKLAWSLICGTLSTAVATDILLGRTS